MIKHCPNTQCHSLQFRKYGTYYRPSDGKLVKRWRCNRCKLHFSSATFQKPYRQHKRRANPKVFQLLCSGVSLRRIALLLNLNRTTVARKLAFLARVSKERQHRFQRTLPKVRQVQFDDLITLEHTKCKPLAISLAVEAPYPKDSGVRSLPHPGLRPLGGNLSRRKYGTQAE